MIPEKVIEVASLSTERGITDAAATMAQVYLGVFLEIAQHTPKAMRGDLFERFLCALTGAVCAELGPERAKQALDAAKLAIDDMTAERARAH